LLAGLYESTGGEIRFNDTPINKIDINKLRQDIGLVAQETQLFAGTIRDNLLFVRPEATDDDCRQALEMAQASSILKREGSSGLGARYAMPIRFVSFLPGESLRRAATRN